MTILITHPHNILLAVLLWTVVTVDAQTTVTRNRGAFGSTPAPTTAEPTKAPTEQPSKVPTTSPTQTPTLSPSDTPSFIASQAPSKAGICFHAEKSNNGQVCQRLYTKDDTETALGSVCLTVNPETGALHLTVDAKPNSSWTLFKTKIWIGPNENEVPKLANGALDLESFPYIHCDSNNGIPRISIPADETEISCNQDGLSELSVIAFVELKDTSTGQKLDTYAYAGKEHTAYLGNGSNGAWMGWFDVAIHCNCDKAPAPKSCPTTPRAFVKNGQVNHKECHAIVTGEGPEAEQAGEVCVTVMGQVLHVIFQANADHALMKNQLYVGQGAAEANLQTMPKKNGTGLPDTRKFKNFACDWEGGRKAFFEIDLKYHCIGDEEYKVAVVAHSTVQKVNDKRELIPGSEMEVFAFEHTGATNNNNNKWYGYFDFMIGCDCPTGTTRRHRRRLLEEGTERFFEEDGSLGGKNKQLAECQATYAYHSNRVSIGFDDLGLQLPSDASKYSWGWTNGPLASSDFAYTLDMVSHHSSSSSKEQTPLLEEHEHQVGHSLGSLTLEYSGDEAILSIHAAEPHFWIRKSFAYVGTGRLPEHFSERKGEHEDSSVYVLDVDHTSFPLFQSSDMSERETRHTHFVDTKDLEDHPVYVVAYAVVCGDFESYEDSMNKGAAKQANEGFSRFRGDGARASA